eukprot:scaffold246960_cov17-Tisochrysis_lutea.AAC.1
MGGARRALMHNFRGKYDIINTAEDSSTGSTRRSNTEKIPGPSISSKPPNSSTMPSFGPQL